MSVRQNSYFVVYLKMNHNFPYILRGLASLLFGIGTPTTCLASDAPVLGILPFNPVRPDEVNLAFDKPMGHQVFVEESTNLLQWNYLPRFWAGDGTREALSLPRRSDGAFFRLSTCPNPEYEWVTATANTSNAGFRMFLSNQIGRPVSFHIHLPTAYLGDPQRRFPVIYWLHGAGAGVAGVAPISQLYVNAMNLGLMPPAIMVFANGLPYGMWPLK